MTAITPRNTTVSISIIYSEIRQEYIDLFGKMQIIPSKLNSVDQQVDRIAKGKARYQAFVGKLGKSIPWHAVALIHSMEKSTDVGAFQCHLHNGDPLSERTIHVPAHRPPHSIGDPPFTWEVSAEDALQIEGLLDEKDWSEPRLLYLLEKYNGFGARRHHQMATPYLWSYSDLYEKGKYVADNTWSDSAVSKQMGAAVILKRAQERGVI